MTQLKLAVAQKDEAEHKYRLEHERFQKLQLDYETLDKDVQDLFKIEKKFNEVKQKHQNLLSDLSKKESKLAELKPRLYQLE